MKKQSKTTHSERLVIRISKELLEKIKNAAEDNEMSVSSYVRFALKKHINKEHMQDRK